MNFQFVVLWTDALVYVLLAMTIVFVIWTLRHEHLRAPWRQVMQRRLGMVAFVVLSAYIIVGLLDSVHFRLAVEGPHQKTYYSTHVTSLFDVLVSPMGDHYEKTYSQPFATHSYSKEAVEKQSGIIARIYPRLKHGGQHLDDPHAEVVWDITTTGIIATVKTVFIWFGICAMLIIILAHRAKQSVGKQLAAIIHGKTRVAWREILITFGVIFLLGYVALNLDNHYHILGTDKVGRDVFYEALKSIRTGLIIGTLTTVVMLPFALLFGTAAGYFGGWIDDIIQYVYTTLSSIPGVLLIVAGVISLQIFISNHPSAFPTVAARADARLLALCVILGITSWTSLCRLLRAETLKLREVNFVEAAIALGVTRFRIIMRHIIPNVMHIVLITIVLDFSMLVLAEAILSYVGVGVDPTTMSWGNMINSARLELARDPVVWWPLLAAFILMFTLVLAANLFADTVRDAFDPKLRMTRY